jgi:hypothetical protein
MIGATSQVHWVREIIAGRQCLIIVGDLVLCEVLQGASSDREVALVERALRRFIVEPMVSPEIGHQLSCVTCAGFHHSQDHRHADRDILYRAQLRAAAR